VCVLHNEYLQPADRRFHAQPIACPACGPTIWLEGIDTVRRRLTALDSAIELLKNGAVVAIRGWAGFIWLAMLPIRKQCSVYAGGSIVTANRLR
jgi:hydrogenase maturation factor HypF (carbamoyltransferase family)